MRKSIFAAAILLSVLLAAPTFAAPNLVINGGFETGDFTGWDQGGNTGFSGVDGDANSGDYAAYFGPVGSLGYISQVLLTMPGTTYAVTFYLANDGGTANAFTADFGGTNLLTLADAPGFGYTRYSYNVQASDPKTTLSFGFRQDPSYLHLDDVSVQEATATPEPATFALFGAAMVCFFIVRMIARSAH